MFAVYTVFVSHSNLLRLIQSINAIQNENDTHNAVIHCSPKQISGSQFPPKNNWKLYLKRRFLCISVKCSEMWVICAIIQKNDSKHAKNALQKLHTANFLISSCPNFWISLQFTSVYSINHYVARSEWFVQWYQKYNEQQNASPLMIPKQIFLWYAAQKQTENCM